MPAKDAIVDLLIRYGFQAAGALVILVIGLFVAKKVGNYADRWLQRQEMEPPVRMLLNTVVRAVVMLIVLLMVLQQFGVSVVPLIAGLSVAGVGVGLALQGALKNLVAGITIIFTKPFRVGQYIDLLGVYGEVKEVNLFSTKLIHADRSLVIIPNRRIIGEILHNYGQVRQLDLSVGVAYATDLSQAIHAARQVVESNSRVLKEFSPEIGISVLADSSINLSVKPWVSVPDYIPARAELYQTLVERFRQERISIPFPQRELRVIGGWGTVPA